MKNVTDSFLSLGYWPSAGSFGFNTDIFATNLINLSVVLGVLIFFGKGVLSDLLDNRKQRILKTIQNSEELRKEALDQLEKARARLRKVEIEADQFRMIGYSEIEREKLNLINATYKTLEQLENYKNETIHFEQQRAIFFFKCGNPGTRSCRIYSHNKICRNFLRKWLKSKINKCSITKQIKLNVFPSEVSHFL